MACGELLPLPREQAVEALSVCGIQPCPLCRRDTDPRPAVGRTRSLRGLVKVGRANMGGKYNLAEGKTYWFEVCLHKSTEDKYCDWAAWKNDK